MQKIMNIKKWLNTPFTLLNSIKNRILFVLGALLFILSFLHLFVPFNINYWISYKPGLKFLGLSGFGIIGFLVLAFSQLIVRPLWKDKNHTRLHLIIWSIAELFLITLILAILYGDSTSPITSEFYYTLKFTSLTLVLWYILGLAILGAMKERSGRENVETKETPDLINFKDEKGQIKFSVSRADLLYLESADNYVMIFYSLNNEVRKELVRNSLKKIQAEVEAYNIIRCHRSFMVNLQNVILARKEGRNYMLKLRHVDQVIPISRNFIPQFKELLES